MVARLGRNWKHNVAKKKAREEGLSKAREAEAKMKERKRR